MTQTQPSGPAPRAKRPGRLPRGLIVTNCVLLGVLGLVTLAPSAGAQAGTGRLPGDYALVGGDVSFANTNAVYVLDSANRQLIALRVDDTQQNAQINILGFRDLRLDSGPRGGGR